jgi:NADP-dependent 3-hydroxy acid dehydrogenase YdfG
MGALPEHRLYFCSTANSSTRREPIMENVIVMTGASSGFGVVAARALARVGHTVYASMREIAGRNAPQIKEVEK